MRIIDEEQLDFDDVLIMPRRSSLASRSEVDIHRLFEYNKCPEGDCDKIYGIPVIAANMGTIGIPRVAKILARNGFFCAMEKHCTADQLKTLFGDLEKQAAIDGVLTINYLNKVFPSIGVKEPLDTLAELGASAYFYVNGVNIDVPNGYCPQLVDRVKEVKNMFPSAFIIAGTVVTPDICQDLVNAGANAVRVGIGSGQFCLTRLKTGVGRPQFSTVVECADACHQMGAFCVSDGGCSTPGDICKALCAGADMVMCGSIFGGCEESEADTIEKDGKTYKQFYGMSSRLAQEKHFGGMATYRTSEGREKWIPCTGPLQSTLDDITGGLRSCGTYIGAKKIKNFSRQAAFYKVRRQLNEKFAGCEDISS